MCCVLCVCLGLGRRWWLAQESPRLFFIFAVHPIWLSFQACGEGRRLGFDWTEAEKINEKSSVTTLASSLPCSKLCVCYARVVRSWLLCFQIGIFFSRSIIKWRCGSLVSAQHAFEKLWGVDLEATEWKPSGGSSLPRRRGGLVISRAHLRLSTSSLPVSTLTLVIQITWSCFRLISPTSHLLTPVRQKKKKKILVSSH